MRLEGKIALVTGGGSGIGHGCAIELARDGADIVLNDRPDSPTLADAAAEIRALGRQCWPIEANVFERSGCESLIEQAVEQAGHLDILVSNPAYSFRSPFLDYPAEEFEKSLQGVLTGGFHMSQLVARHFVEQKIAGNIVFISSIQAELPIVNCVAYGAAKAGLNHMTKTIAVELFEHHINVNVIEPGWIDTPGERRFFTEEQLRGEGAKLPWGRLGTPSDIGKAAAFLSSADSDYITGTVLKVDGGFEFRGCREIPAEI